MKRILFASALLSCAALAASLPVAQGQQQQAVVIQGGTLIDGNGGAPVANAVVVIQGNRIAQVGVAGQVQVPAGARVIQANGKWVLPGLIDAKGNYNWYYGEPYLYYGVTSVMVSAGRNNQGMSERDAINHGIFAGPRLFGTIVTIDGPGPELKKPDNYKPGDGTRVIRTAEEGVAHVRTMVDTGADIITFQNGDGPPEVFAAAVAEAQRLGKGIDFRAMGPQTRAREVAAMGTGIVLVHTGNSGSQIAKDPSKWATYIDLAPDAYADMDEAKANDQIKYLVSRQMLLEPDLMATARGFHKNWKRVQQEDRDFANLPNLRSYYPEYAFRQVWENVKSPETYMKPDEIQRRALGFKNHAWFLKHYVDAGGRLVAASDDPQTPPGLGVHQEMTAFVEDVGLTPMQAIQAGTSWVADGFKIADVGRVQAGKLADILIVDADPSQDIMNLRKINMVLKDGKVLDRAFHADYKGSMFNNSTLHDFDANVEGSDWADALKRATWRPNVLNGRYNAAGGFDSELSPTPGIEGIAPHTVTHGSPETAIKVTGFNFVRGSKVEINGKPVPTKAVSRTELEATVSRELLAQAGKLHLTVRNPKPLATTQWGDVSNDAYVLVPFEFTKVLPQPKW
jgi:hypothetical protein